MVVYNVLTGKKEEFVPQNPQDVKMYACGITVSGDAHLGHAKQALQFDVIRKYIEYSGFKVTYVRNHTDVDDKIIIKAQSENIDPLDFSKRYIDRNNEDMKSLGINPADHEPKASETIQEIIFFVSALIEKNLAYATKDGDVFFKVENFPGYGKLSRRNIDELYENVRKAAVGEKEKNIDFALWKAAKENEIYWDSPWGKGRPGWHIECSAMCYKYLGKTIDIHGGGKDLLFPHHENEIAQSEGLFGVDLAKYWIHCGLVKVNGEKMSKSLGNTIIIRDLLNKYHPEVIKFLILQTNYKSDLNVIDNMFEEAEKHLYNIYKCLQKLKEKNQDVKAGTLSAKIKSDFADAMDEDFNTALAIANLFKYTKEINSIIKTNQIELLNGIYDTIRSCYAIFSILQEDPSVFINSLIQKYIKEFKLDESAINDLILKRSQFKQAKNYEEADKIKIQLKKTGILLEDAGDSTRWDIDFSFKNENN